VPGSKRETELWKRIQREDFEGLIAAEDLEIETVFDLLDYAAYFDLLGMPRPTDLRLAFHHFVEDGLAIEQDDGHAAITNLGAILFANRMSQFPLIRRKALRIIRYTGNGRACDRRERIMERGYALDLSAAYDFIDGALPTTEEISGTRRDARNAFPQTAIRELIVNALIHQDLSITGTGPMVEIFNNRIEFTNPGTPLVRIERIVNDPPQSRNEKLSALMRRLGYCEEAGSGWDIIIEGCEDYLLPAPIIDASSGISTRVTLSAHKDYRNMTPDERLDACYWHACVSYGRGEYISNSTLRNRFGLKATNTSQISRLLKEAVEKPLIKPLDPSTSPRYMVYIPYWA
jgi:predicted HTH transcriptional regulator